MFLCTVLHRHSETVGEIFDNEQVFQEDCVFRFPWSIKLPHQPPPHPRRWRLLLFTSKKSGVPYLFVVHVCLCVCKWSSVFHPSAVRGFTCARRFHSKWRVCVCVCARASVSLTGYTPSPRTWTPLPHCPRVPGINAVPFSVFSVNTPSLSLSLSPPLSLSHRPSLPSHSGHHSFSFEWCLGSCVEVPLTDQKMSCHVTATNGGVLHLTKAQILK